MSWPESYGLKDSAGWFNPWPVKYLLPAAKWFPIYWPNADWKVVPFPPTPGVGPVPPDGAILQWWDLPKDQWPVAAPWEPKVFGAWPASQISTSEDLVNHPPFGFISLKVPGQLITSGNEIPFVNFQIHTRPDGLEYFNRMKIMSRQTPMGQKFYLIDENWEFAEYNYREYRKAIKAKRQERFCEMIAAEIMRRRGKLQPTKDLFE